MKKLSVIVILFVIALGSQLLAEDQPKAELFGGYQFTRIGGEGGLNANGWNGSVAGNINKWFGVKADFSGAYANVAGVDVNAHTYTFGPVFSARGERATPFAHALFGGFRASAGFAGADASVNGFAMMVGGGVDVKASDRIAVRVFQADWIVWHAEGITEKQNARISAGVVFRF